ncbi:hypothetical protein B566_EDAN007153 [Ephemera danica]|nr:hypothetical protein B566_EDAN007153 [Ephemera danica]
MERGIVDWRADLHQKVWRTRSSCVVCEPQRLGVVRCARFLDIVYDRVETTHSPMSPLSEMNGGPVSITHTIDTNSTTLKAGPKCPAGRDAPDKGAKRWLEDRRDDDGAEGLWRMNDTLYDLTSFALRHPGGAQWIHITKGTDITEAFESHHISPKPAEMLHKFAVRPARTPRVRKGTDITEAFECHHYSPLPAQMLNKFFVRSATTPRSSPYTFEPDGFYSKLKERVNVILNKPSDHGPALQSKIIMDSMVFAIFAFAMLSAYFQSTILALLSGLALGMSSTIAHNFFHIKDKSLVHRYLTWITSPIFYCIVFPLEFIRRILLVGVTLTDLLPFTIPSAMLLCSPQGQMLSTLYLWAKVVMGGSFYFTLVGINAAHHHPYIFHEGDAVRENRDWGLSQLDAVLTNFGHHTLHHLFPTVDHAHLPRLYPALAETLDEFRVPFRTSSFSDLIIGQFMQLVRTEPNLEPPITLPSRNSPYTFHPDGFYAKLRQRVYELMPEMSDRGAAQKSCIISDTIVVSFFVTAMWAAHMQSTLIATVAGLLLGINTVVAHNYIDLCENFRRYYFDLSPLSSNTWRVSHSLSHHMFPNTASDLEASLIVTLAEPFFYWLPNKKKSFLFRYISWIYSPVIYSFLFLGDWARRIIIEGFRPSDLISYTWPAAMLMCAPSGQIFNTLVLWVYTMFMGSLYFGFVGFNAAHHHPAAFHEGDTPRGDRDWGLAQLDAVLERTDISGVSSTWTHDEHGKPQVFIDNSRSYSFWTHCKVLATFGHHTLHHLFPTIDHAHLPRIYPVLAQTLTEFRVQFRSLEFSELIKGQFLQLARDEPNLVPPGYLPESTNTSD